MSIEKNCDALNYVNRFLIDFSTVVLINGHKSRQSIAGDLSTLLPTESQRGSVSVG
jgi:hypothetical protein